MRRILCSLLTLPLFFMATHAQSEEASPSLDIRVVKMESSSSQKRQCSLEFDITNNAYGTVHKIRAGLIGYDDRGRQVDELLSANADNRSGFSYKPIALGQTVKNVGSATFKEECQYLTEIQFDGVDEDDCAMRMLPEDVSCQDFTSLESDLDSLSIRKAN